MTAVWLTALQVISLIVLAISIVVSIVAARRLTAATKRLTAEYELVRKTNEKTNEIMSKWES